MSVNPQTQVGNKLYLGPAAVITAYSDGSAHLDIGTLITGNGTETVNFSGHGELPINVNFNKAVLTLDSATSTIIQGHTEFTSETSTIVRGSMEFIGANVSLDAGTSTIIQGYTEFNSGASIIIEAGTETRINGDLFIGSATTSFSGSEVNFDAATSISIQGITEFTSEASTSIYGYTNFKSGASTVIESGASTSIYGYTNFKSGASTVIESGASTSIYGPVVFSGASAILTMESGTTTNISGTFNHYGNVTVHPSVTLTLHKTPILGTDAVNKSYVDSTASSVISTIEGFSGPEFYQTIYEISSIIAELSGTDASTIMTTNSVLTSTINALAGDTFSLYKAVDQLYVHFFQNSLNTSSVSNLYFTGESSSVFVNTDLINFAALASNVIVASSTTSSSSSTTDDEDQVPNIGPPMINS
jgi:hypothetical protein